MNSFYGKTLQNQQNMNRNFSIITNKTLNSRVLDPLFEDYFLLNEEQSYVCMKTKKFNINTNNLLGVNILSFAK